MIFIHGTKIRTEYLGTVAEWCEVCERVRVFNLQDRFRSAHLYFIRITPETQLAPARKCWRCCAEFYFDFQDYPEMLTEEEGRTLPMDEIIRRTNPRLCRETEPRPVPSPPPGHGPCPLCGAELQPTSATILECP